MKYMNARDMKEFSKNLNSVFWILNDITKTIVFETSVYEQDGEDVLHIQVCGRDSEWNNRLECIGSGMLIPNPIIQIIEGVV